MRIIKNILVFLIESNLFIALSAALATFSAQVLLQQEQGLHPYLFIIFFATFFDYNLHRLYTLHFASEALKGERHAWLLKNKMLFYLLMACASLGFLISIFYAKTEVLIALIPFAFITIFYSIPFIRWNNKLIRLRDLPYLKIFFIAINWTMITVILPLVQYGPTISTIEIAGIVTARFFFILALCIPFDIRDIEIDKRAGLKTIPNNIGEENSYRLAYMSLLISALIGLIHYLNSATPYFALSIGISAIISAIAIYNANKRLNNLYLYGVIDGQIIVQSIFILMSSWIHPI